jgi:hypothetical protein
MCLLELSWWRRSLDRLRPRVLEFESRRGLLFLRLRLRLALRRCLLRFEWRRLRLKLRDLLLLRFLLREWRSDRADSSRSASFLARPISRTRSASVHDIQSPFKVYLLGSGRCGPPCRSSPASFGSSASSHPRSTHKLSICFSSTSRRTSWLLFGPPPFLLARDVSRRRVLLRAALTTAI